MQNFPYLKIDRIEFMTTYHCPGKCAHCSVGDRINTPGPHHVPVKESAEAIRWLAESFCMKSIMTFGGEPLLYPEVICVLHKTARNCGIPKRQLITNGYFSKRPERIRQVAEELAAAGVNDLLLSVDAFHQAAIPLEPVRFFAECMQRAAPGVIQLQPSWVVNEEHDDPWNARTREMLAAFDGLGIPRGRGDDIFLAGNAAKNLAQYYPAPCLDLQDRCGSRPYTEPLDHITSLSVEPNGNVVACAVPIGNLHQETMAEIAARYDPYVDARSRAVLTGGAKGLLELAQKHGISVDLSQCWSVCDLCRQMNDKWKETDVKI